MNRPLRASMSAPLATMNLPVRAMMRAPWGGGRRALHRAARRASRRQHGMLLAIAIGLPWFGAGVQADPQDIPQPDAYWAVAGSFLNQSAAQSAAQELARKTGAAPTIITATTPTGRMHRVALGPWPSTTAALEAVRRLQTAGYTDAWKLAAADTGDASNPRGERIGNASRPGGEGILPSHAPQGAQIPAPFRRVDQTKRFRKLGLTQGPVTSADAGRHSTASKRSHCPNLLPS